MVSILTGPFGPVQRANRQDEPRGVRVSILTGPFGPVQRTRPRGTPARLRVSILTGPFGPVQPGLLFGGAPWLAFQSSPALSGRCNLAALIPRLRNQVSILTGPFGPVQHPYIRPRGFKRRGFNPHRPFRAGATRTGGPGRAPVPRCFNPHRPFRAGATSGQRQRPRWASVSILTGPFGPVQLVVDMLDVTDSVLVSILTGPFGPVQRAPTAAQRPFSRRFNPHRPFRAGATLSLGSRFQRLLGFNPHRPFRAGATLYFDGTSRYQTSCFNPHRPFRAGATGEAQQGRAGHRHVSILTGPFGPVQPTPATLR